MDEFGKLSAYHKITAHWFLSDCRSRSQIDSVNVPHEAKKNLLTSVGIEPTTSGLDLPSLCRLSYKVAQRKSGTILDGESRRRESKGTYECCAA